jgi:hypothetical protein
MSEQQPEQQPEPEGLTDEAISPDEFPDVRGDLDERTDPDLANTTTDQGHDVEPGGAAR